MIINVVEQANTPNFSRLGDIVTPLRLLELFVDDALVDIIVGNTKLYSHGEEANSFEITNEKNCLLLSMLPLSGCHKGDDR